jgi:hypothetical protein
MARHESAASRPVSAQPPTPRKHGLRGRDRRVALADFLAFLAGALHPQRDARELRLRFEEGLRRLMPLRAILLRYGPLDRPIHASTALQRLSLEVPGFPPATAVIEAQFDPDSGLDEWDVQTLQTARYVAALVIEIERCRQALPLRRPPADQSMPLVGASAAVGTLRERIARVAATDFTVLIEGGIDPQPHFAEG